MKLIPGCDLAVQAAMNESNMENTNLKGHRERVRNRLLKGEILSDEQLLELLLMYGIPQKDVRPLAKNLLEEFDSLEAVINTDHKVLMKKALVKENTVALFKLFKILAIRYNNKRTNNKTAEPEQINLFGKPIDKEKGLQIFTNAVTRDMLMILPLLPETRNINVITAFIKKNLHYNSEESRKRYTHYIVKRLFPDGIADCSLIRFGHSFVNTSDLQDVCFYRFLHAEPLLHKIMTELFLPSISRGFVKRNEIVQFTDAIFPNLKSNDKCVQAIVDVLVKTNMCKLQKQELTLKNRKPNIASFTYILHSEFKEPGMYAHNLLKGNSYIAAMLWEPNYTEEMLYELRNNGYISKVSNIDGIKQFTTKYHLEEITELLIMQKGQN